jgi:hypothetical protein
MAICFYRAFVCSKSTGNAVSDELSYIYPTQGIRKFTNWLSQAGEARMWYSPWNMPFGLSKIHPSVSAAFAQPVNCYAKYFAYIWWDFRFSRRRMCRLSSGMLRRIFWSTFRTGPSPWCWRQYEPHKHQSVSTRLHSVISQEQPCLN